MPSMVRPPDDVVSRMEPPGRESNALGRRRRGSQMQLELPSTSSGDRIHSAVVARSGSPAGLPSTSRHTRTVPSSKPPPLTMTGVPSCSARYA